VTGGKTSLRQLSGSFRRIALVVNPTAGIGFTRLGPILKDLIEAIHPALVTTDPFVRKDGTIDLDELSKRRHSSSSKSLPQRILKPSNPVLFLSSEATEPREMFLRRFAEAADESPSSRLALGPRTSPPRYR